MRRGLLAYVVVAAVLGGLWVLAAIPGREPGVPAAPAAGAAGPELVLREVEMREVRKTGPQYRLFSTEATYRLAARTLSAAGVTLTLPADRGAVVMQARKADWNMGTGRIALPEGCSAKNAEGWSAVVGTAQLFLPERVLSAGGRASIDGPGVRVAGDNLVWRWREGTMTLLSPKTRFEPARVQGKRG